MEFESFNEGTLLHVGLSVGDSAKVDDLLAIIGVVAMGMEKINFFWYLKKISWLALVGFVCGAIVFFFTRTLF